MRYTLASLFTLLVVGVASGVPDDPTATASRNPTASLPTRCETVAEPVNVSPKQWDELSESPRPHAVPSAETVAGVETALHEFVACLNDRPDLASPPGVGSGRMTLVWVGEPWLLPDARVAAPIIARRGVSAEAWSLVVLMPQDERYIVDTVAAFGARGRSPSVFQPILHSGPV